MASQVFYRKYRSQSFSDLAGQESVKQTLLNALKTGHISHAYLFCGPRGTGKTSTARIFAKAVNCLTTGGKGEPCNTCEMCLAISEGRAMDIIEIDAASNNSVDEIRTLRERVNVSPAQARYKIYIIDEFHMLSNAASNALLKTLEEPPPHVIFILATTEIHKILPTIMSRCQRFDFHRLSQADITGRLDYIVNAEKLKIEPDAMKMVAKAASGSLRDAENLLEQLVTFYGSDINFRQVQELLGITGDARVKELAKQIFHDDTRTAIKTINSVNSDGLDLRNFKRELVEYLRCLLLVKTGSPEAIDVTAEDMKELKELAEKAPLPKILKVIKLFSQAEVGTENHTVLPFELAIIDSAQKEEAPHQAAQPAPRPMAETTAHSAAPRTVHPVENKPQMARAYTPANPAPVHEKKDMPATAEHKPAPVAHFSALDAGSVCEKLKHDWRSILEHVPVDVKKNHTAVAILRSSGVTPVTFEKDTLTISLRYGYMKDKLEEMENLRVTEKIFSSYMGHNCKVQCILENNHLVKAALKLGAEIVDVEET
ncbi:MAG: DNA polymerase III subunit gamma/tau [Dehalococcoidales bacterium]|nr:DNA polymerase III subunit gamma/tau [Dehalococcoidales bacterium]